MGRQQLHHRPTTARPGEHHSAPGGSSGAAEAATSVTLGMPPVARAAGMPPLAALELRCLAGTPKLLAPSLVAFRALLLVPLVLWVAAVGSGAALHDGQEPPKGADKAAIDHPLLDFDRSVFRIWGPLLPLLPYLVRLLAMTAGAAAVQMTWPPRPAGANGAASHRPPGPPPYGNPSATAPARVTYPLVGVAYLAAALLRIAMYSGHLVVQRYHGLALLSDHIFLAASILACVQCEMVMCLSDAYKCEVRLGQLPPAVPVAGPGGGGSNSNSTGRALRLLGAILASSEFFVVAALVGNMLLFFYVAADMHFTAHHYHYAPESWAALAAGAVVFQLPSVLLLTASVSRT